MMSESIRSRLMIARPQSIEVVETYQVQITLGNNPTCQLSGAQDNPNGLVRVTVPYDGYQHFPISSARSVIEDLGAFDPATPSQAVIGWLGISEPYDWLFGRRESDGLELIEPIKVLLRDERLLSPQDWVSDSQMCLNEHEYTPAKPRYSPVNLKMKIWDSTSDYYVVVKQALEAASKARNSVEIIQLLSGEMLQGGVFMMDMTIEMMLPSDINPAEIQPDVTRLGLNWVVIPQPEELKIYDWGLEKYVEWRYNPDAGMIEMPNMKLTPAEPARGSNLRPYRANLSLVIRQASKVILESEMKGSLALEVNGLLLSGRQVAWMDTTGRRVDAREIVRMKTVLKAAFEIDLNHLFLNRQAVAYRQWVLPGVVLTPARLDDLAGALSDLGYELKKEDTPAAGMSPGDNPEKPVFGHVAGERWEVQQDWEPVNVAIDLWAMQVAPSQTEHEVTGSQGTVRTTLTTSDLLISARGRSSCQGSVLAGDLDRLMAILKSRLMSIATHR